MKSALRTVLVQTGDSTLTVYYDARDFNPRWTQRDHLNAAADSLLNALCHADAHALDPAHYDVAHLGDIYHTAYQQDDLPDSARAVALATLEVALSQALLGYARDLRTGRAFPLDTARARWTIRDSLSVLQGEAPSDLKKTLTPPQEGYAALHDALDRYRALADSGGWRPLARPLEPGVADADVQTLRLRLAATGDLDAGDAGVTYDAALAEAVGRFQRRHGLAASGVVDEATRQALNVPADARARQLEVALERRRWLPVALGKTYLVANTADSHLYGFRDGVATLRLPMTTDPACRRPPLVADSVTAVTFTPGGGARLSLGTAALDVTATVEGNAGCFRVRMPGPLASFVLDGTDRWNEARVGEALAAPETRTVALASPLPFYALPRTAWVEDGTVQFRDETPADRALARSLRPRNPRETGQACRVLTAPR